MRVRSKLDIMYEQGRACTEEMWPVTVDDYQPLEPLYARAEVCLDRVKWPGWARFTILDLHVLHPASEVYADGWRLTADGRFRRISVRMGDDWTVVLDWPGAIQDPPPPPLEREDRRVEQMIPLYEAKFVHLYDTRWGGYDESGTYQHLDKP